MTVKTDLSMEELEHLARQYHQKQRLWIRLRAIILALKGHTAQWIADALGCQSRSVELWVHKFNRDGWTALLEKPRPGRPKILPTDQEADLCRRINAGPLPEDGICAFRALDIQIILEVEFGVLYRLGGVYDLLDRLGYSRLVPRPEHPKADPEQQEEFKRKINDMIDEVRREHPDDEVEVWFEDEARFGQKGTTTRVWAPTGSRPTVVKQTEYQYLWVVTAVCVSTGASWGLLSPDMNTEVMNDFLMQLSQRLAPRTHAVLIWDGAGFHVSGELVVPANVTLIKLPPYSPKLNPVENLWHYLREHYWSNKPYRDYDHLIDAALDGLGRVCPDRERMKTVCAAPYIDSSRKN